MRYFTCIITICSLLLGCGHQESPFNTLKVGAIAGPEADLVHTAAMVAEKEYGLKVKVIEFSDYNLPNIALQDGSLDANVYQHLPYLEAAKAAHGYDLEAIGKTFIYPTGIYSKKYKKLDELPEKAVIAIPNDPSNESRALLLLQKAGLITLKQEAQNANLHDILSNPKHLQLKEIDAAQLSRVLDDVAAAVINTTFAVPAGLTPSRDALYTEDKDSPYANLIVVKRNNTHKKELNELVSALNSPDVQKKANELFGENAIPAW